MNHHELSTFLLKSVVDVTYFPLFAPAVDAMDADAMRLLSLLGTQQMQETPQLALCHHLGLQRYCEGSLVEGPVSMGSMGSMAGGSP